MSGRLAVCTDSSAHLVDDDGILVVPVTIVVDGQPLDETELEHDGFYDRLDRGARVTTSQPSPGRFAEAYARQAGAGAEAILSLHLDARVSGTAGSAELAAREAPVPVTVVALDTLGFGVGRAVSAAAEAARAGAEVEEAVGRARAAAARLRTVFAAGGAPGGRVATGPGLALLTAEGGATTAFGRCAGPEAAAERLAEAALAGGVPPWAAVGHAHARAAAHADGLAELLADAGVDRLDRYRVGPSVGAHVGPDCFGAFWEVPARP